VPQHRDGAQIYEKWVKPAMVDIPRVAAPTWPQPVQ